jgi:hypothetical protein
VEGGWIDWVLIGMYHSSDAVLGFQFNDDCSRLRNLNRVYMLIMIRAIDLAPGLHSASYKPSSILIS